MAYGNGRRFVMDTGLFQEDILELTDGGVWDSGEYGYDTEYITQHEVGPGYRGFCA